MKFSEEEVYVLGMAFSLVVSLLVSIPFCKVNLKWYWCHKRRDSLNDLITITIFGLLCGVMLIYGCRIVFYYSSVWWVFIIGICLECIALYVYLNPLNRKYIENNVQSLTPEEAAASIRKREVPVFNQLLGIMLLNGGLAMLGVGFFDWLMPDVVEIQDSPRRTCYEYKVNSYYALPFENGMKPGGSYIENLTNDTIYRLVIDYAFLGEELYNYYTVQGKYPPNSFCKMPGRTLHVMDTIAPVMLPSYGRLGRYRTQRAYLTDYTHMWDFKSANLFQFGLKGNKWVDTIKEDRNKLIHENYKEYRAYKVINPYPYPRLVPDSLRRKSSRKHKNSMYK